MSERKYQREDIWGNKYWEDDQGNRTYEREDVWGNKYYEDEHGNRTYEREDIWGNKYREDEDGNREYEREDIWGNKYREDNEGKRIYEREDIWGNKYEEKSDGGCFLTTACVEYAGLPDGCTELQTMRAFRDQYIRTLPNADRLLGDYYRLAPIIIARIKSQPDSETIFQRLMAALEEAVTLIQSGRKAEALSFCTREFSILREKYGCQ